MASDFKFTTEGSITITANTASETLLVPGNDGDGRRLLELEVMTTGTFDSNTVAIKRRAPDGATYVNPADGAYSVTSADSAPTQIHAHSTTVTPGAGYFYTSTGGGGSEVTVINYNAVWG